EGKQLLLISLLTLLLGMDFLTITKGSIEGIKVAPGPYFDGVAVMAATCLYLLLTYGLGLYRDWKTTYYRRLPAAVERHRLSEEYQREQRERFRRIKQIAPDIKQLRAIRSQKLEEFPIPPTAEPRADASSDERRELEQKWF